MEEEMGHEHGYNYYIIPLIVVGVLSCVAVAGLFLLIATKLISLMF